MYICIVIFFLFFMKEFYKNIILYFRKERKNNILSINFSERLSWQYNFLLILKGNKFCFYSKKEINYFFSINYNNICIFSFYYACLSFCILIVKFSIENIENKLLT